MANFNKCILAGNLVRDPETKVLPNGTTVCDLGLAINRKWTQDGVAKEEVTFVDCTAFAKTADLIAKYLKKGSPALIEGRLKLDQWEAQDGSKRSKLRVIIDNVQFLGSAPERSGDAPAPSPAARYQPRGPAPAARRPAPAALEYGGEPGAAGPAVPVDDDPIPF